MPSSDELPVEFGRYRILEKLGQGGMGTVYLAEDTQLGRRVALKVPHFTPEDGPTVIERFDREARVAAGIEHPNICQVYDVGELNGIHFIIMPYIDGTPLARKVEPNRPMPAREAVLLVRQLALAVAVMHERGVIHRDLKPDNVLLRPGGEPVIMDFGLARSFTGTGRLTTRGAVVGTPAYMSPEQVRGEGTELRPTTDVYSLGVILFELLTGQVPFGGPFHAVYAQILFTPPVAPSQLRSDVDARLDAICLKAMAKTPADRYASMAEFAAVLGAYSLLMETVLEGTPAGAAPLPSKTRAEPPQKTTLTPLQSASRARSLAETLPKATCPTCGKRYKLPAGTMGKKVRCPACGTTFKILSAVPTVPPAPAREVAETGRLADAKLETRGELQQGNALPQVDPDLIGMALHEIAELKENTAPPGWRILRPASNPQGWNPGLARPPDSAESSRLRQTLLLDRLRRLLRAMGREPTDFGTGCVLAFTGLLADVVLGSATGWVIGAVAGLVLRLHGDVAQTGAGVGMLLGIGFGVIFVFKFESVLRARPREKLIELLMKEYPHEVQSWGGVVVLRNAATIQELIHMLEAKLKRPGE